MIKKRISWSSKYSLFIYEDNSGEYEIKRIYLTPLAEFGYIERSHYHKHTRNHRVSETSYQFVLNIPLNRGKIYSCNMSCNYILPSLFDVETWSYSSKYYHDEILTLNGCEILLSKINLDIISYINKERSSHFYEKRKNLPLSIKFEYDEIQFAFENDYYVFLQWDAYTFLRKVLEIKIKDGPDYDDRA